MKNTDILNCRRLTGIVLFLLISAGLFAQTNFSGTWELNESKSKLSEGGGPLGARSMIVTQDATILAANQKMIGRDGEEFNITAKYNLDGTLSENAFMMDRIRKSVLTWSDDKKSITINSTMNFERDGETREVKTTEKWSISPDGKTLDVESTRTSRDGEIRIVTLAYDKK